MSTDGINLLIWDTSAINKLAMQDDQERMAAKAAQRYTNCIPMYALQEIAATRCQNKRLSLFDTCRTIKGDSGIVMPSPPKLIIDALCAFAQSGEICRSLFEPIPQYERGLETGHVFDDDLARAQSAENASRNRQMEKWFDLMSPPLIRQFGLTEYSSKNSGQIIRQAKTLGLVTDHIRYYCESILGYTVGIDFAERFKMAFPPMTAFVYACLLGHYYHYVSPLTKKRAGYMDIFAAAYLPLSPRFVSDDHKQQTILRDVAKGYGLPTEILWFSGEFKETLLN